MSKSFTDQSSVFIDETVLYDTWTPEELPEREGELDDLHDALAPVARGAAPHNTFVYGKTGQGKTVGVNFKLKGLAGFAEENGIDLSVVRYSCAKDSSSYQVASNLVDQLSGSKPRGYDLKTVFDLLYDELQELGGTVIIVLDEIDSIGTNDEILYELPRARANGHLEEMWVSVIGISNDFEFRDNLSPKVKDTLCDEEIHFSPYNANELRSILSRRADKAFHDGVLADDVIPLCSALAAQDKGSARQAIRYLYKAGELAANSTEDKVTVNHVREAEEAIERKSIEKGIRDLTTQDHLALMAIVALETEGKAPARTREVYSRYKDIANKIDADTIAMRRVRDHLQDLDLAGVVNAIEKNQGLRGGHHYVFEVSADLGMTIDVLQENDRLGDAMDLLT
ncbi:Cdc6/Cdc18 family protein [Haloarcula marismortui]|jgi:cell division control protein 6|uniref:ORC1-type DNA replication protein n=1 Tax=Haloarcula marismortui ATCC 33799 TaxID=662475 RepID=M0KVG7_9EURY|nr:orc1/cdc6 family replication initiation protein [Haloarcula californiae]EMA24903.1 cell division control protein 6 [Haloarcula californiae ATCC 33799]